jgi:hypothetical protein
MRFFKDGLTRRFSKRTTQFSPRRQFILSGVPSDCKDISRSTLTVDNKSKRPTTKAVKHMLAGLQTKFNSTHFKNLQYIAERWQQCGVTS